MLVRCLYNKQNNTWLLGDMEFLFSCSMRYVTLSLCSLVRNQVEHSSIFAHPGITPYITLRFTYSTHHYYHYYCQLQNQTKALLCGTARLDYITRLPLLVYCCTTQGQILHMCLSINFWNNLQLYDNH